MENTNTATKLTYSMALDIAINAVENEEVKDKLEALKIQIAKKNSSGSGKPTKNQVENEKIMNVIYEVLATDGGSHTITELIKMDERLNDYTNQKMSALLKKLADSGRVTKTKDKKTTLFSAVVE